MKDTKLHSIFFLLLVVLIIYLPAVTGTINSVDDTHIINAYGINGHRTLQQIFVPGSQFYFRPLIELTYYLDNLLWGLNPTVMHLENIVLHALNVLLVFHIAVRISTLTGGLPVMPFIGALIFAIHPANTEAVSWIAGRTDPLAAFFLLLSTLFLLKSLQSGRSKDYYLSFTAMLLAFLAKETSVMLLFSSVLVVMSFKSVNAMFSANQLRIRRLISYSYAILFVVVAGCVVVRGLMKPVGTDNVFSVVFQNRYNLVAILRDTLVTGGFYVKKLLVPFPLNFAISDVNEGYIVVGLAVVALAIYLVRKMNVPVSFVLAGLVFIFPAVVVKISGVTWTPVAERYLYIPSAFFCIGLSGLLVHIAAPKKYRVFFYSTVVFIVVTAGFFTYRRNIVWQDNLTLYQDAVLKSPNFGDVHNEFGVALAKKGDYESAKKHFHLAEQLSKRQVIQEVARLNQLNCELQGKTILEKKEIVENYLDSHTRVHPDILKILRNVTLDIWQTENDEKNKMLLSKRIITLNDRIYREIKDPVCLYNNGQLLLTAGDKSAALAYFRKTVATAPSDAYYVSAARKLVKRLEDM